MQRFLRISSAFKTVPILGALAFILVANIVLHIWDPMKGLNPDTVPAPHTWAWWAVRDYRQLPKAPDVVLLGSSQMMSPTWWQEADYRQTGVELVVDHRSKRLESLLQQSVPGSDARCFNFALPGGMMSDAAMVARAMFHGDKGKPKIAVIGLSPREFMDNSFHCPAGTKHYQYLSKFCDTSDVEQRIGAPELPTRIQFLAQKVLYPKWKCKDIQMVGAAVLTTPFESLYKLMPPSRLDTVADADQQTVIFKDELRRGFWIAKPNNPDRYLDLPGDCLRRLAKPNNRMFENQREWLTVFIDTCNKEGVAVVLVNMPISPQARTLICPGIYERHVAMLEQFSKKYNLPLVDANKLVLTKSDFTDWSHMDAGGGKMMLTLIANSIGTRPELAASLLSRDSEIAAKSVRPTE